MKNNPLVTVYITNYNYGKYIRQSIESVLSQTLQDFELLIIDDGSTDNSKEIIEDFINVPKVNIIYQQNKGLNVTNNIAMRASRGKYIMRLDADDFLTSNALEVMSKILENNAELGLVFPDYYYVDANGNKTGQEIRHNFDSEVSLYDQPAHGACTMIRLEYLKKLGGYNESFTCQDGYDLWIKFIMHYKVTNVNEPLFYYRRHGNNLTVNEERILSTRKKIKETYIDSFKVSTPSTVVVIPVRNTYINNVNWPLYLIKGNTVLFHTIKKVFEAKKVNWIVITSSDEEILDHVNSIKNDFGERLIIVQRPEQFSRSNETLYKTFEYVLQELEKLDLTPQALLSLSLEYPFFTSDLIDDAINTLSIFKADSLLSVRPDNKMYYQHIGHGLVPILDQDKFSKLEREALYKGLGGVVITTVKSLMENKKMPAGKVGHIVVDEKSAFGIFSSWDFKVFNSINN